MPKNEWVKTYVDQVLQQWNGWDRSLEINTSHVERLESRLDSFFEAIEKKVWIELIF